MTTRLAYDADRDGWSAASFHDKVNTYGAAVLLGRTAGAVFGAYNPRGWIGGCRDLKAPPKY